MKTFSFFTVPVSFRKALIMYLHMAKKHRTSRNLIIWLLLLFLIAFACFIVLDVFFMNRKQPDEKENDGLAPNHEMTASPIEKPAESSELGNVTITLSDYLVFDLSGIDFRFVIAKLHVKADGPTNIPLSHFKTSEGITLDQTSSYIETLEAHNLYTGRQNVWFSLISEETDYEANVFIPVTGNTNTVSVSCDFGNNGDLRFSMIPANGRAEMLQYEAEDVITDGKSYQMTVSKAYDITGLPLYQKTGSEESEYLLPSTVKVYAFEVNAVSLYGDTIVIEEAVYVPSNSAETFTALGSDIRSMKYDNMIGVPVTEHTTGYLLFYAYDPDDAPVYYNGVLKLKLLGNDGWISIGVDLNEG